MDSALGVQSHRLSQDIDAVVYNSGTVCSLICMHPLARLPGKGHHVRQLLDPQNRNYKPIDKQTPSYNFAVLVMQSITAHHDIKSLLCS